MPLTLAPYVLKNLSITIKLKTGGTAQEYRCQLHSATLSPESNTIDYDTFCGTTSQPGVTKWSLSLSGFQSFTDATDLSMFLFTNDGALCTYTMIPSGGAPSASNPGFQGDCYATATAIGGEVGNAPTFDVTLPCTGAPTKIIA